LDRRQGKVSVARGGLVLTTAALGAHGEHPAAVSRDAALSYRELAERADAVATALTRGGVPVGAPVGLTSVGRAFDELVGLVGILSSGRVVVPLDATAPPRRLASILAARGARALVSDGGPRGDKLAHSVRGELEAHRSDLVTIALDERGGLVTAAPGSAPGAPAAAPPEPASLACVLHTSGSTGTPKPVPITWEGLDAFTGWAADLCGLTAEDRVLRVAELIFDLAWFDHVATLRRGATLCTMSRRELAAGRATVEAIEALAPNVIYGVPSMFMRVTAALGQGVPLASPPRVVFFAGEVFPPRELAAFAAAVPEAALFNLYGPTETNVCTYHAVARDELDGVRETPIGIACPYAQCELRGETDKSLVIDGPGVGELWVSGPTTLDGGPFATRDRVERKDDGRFYFRGRIDRVIKVRGYRVEPQEVEIALAEHPGVRQAAIVAVDDPKLGKVLRGFVELRGDNASAPDDRALRKFLAERLPGYMVPERVTPLDALPRTPTGKIDYSGLIGR
jgi:acyl-coenzyme A synthetase/AMP-(fatty) acid ligase